MAYIYMPLFFSIVGYLIIYVAALPLITTAASLSSIITAKDDITINENQLNSIFETPVNNTGAESVKKSDVKWPGIGDHYGRVSCQRIGLNADLYFGDSMYIMKYGIGQYPGSHIPGDNGPIMLAAHNTTYFLPLEDVTQGDIIEIETSYGTYQYEVTGMRIADKNDRSAYDLTQKKEQLIMYTCYPFNMLGTLQERYFVYADKISGPVIDRTE